MTRKTIKGNFIKFCNLIIAEAFLVFILSSVLFFYFFYVLGQLNLYLYIPGLIFPVKIIYKIYKNRKDKRNNIDTDRPEKKVIETSQEEFVLKESDILRLTHNMDYSNELVRLFENRRKHFLELHIGFMTIFTIAYTFIVDFFNIIGEKSFNYGIIILLISSIINIVWNLIPNETELRLNDKEEYTNFYYRYHDLNKETFSKNYNRNIKESDYIENIRRILCFQENYVKIASRTRDITLFSLLIFTSCLLVGFLLTIFQVRI